MKRKTVRRFIVMAIVMATLLLSVAYMASAQTPTSAPATQPAATAPAAPDIMIKSVTPTMVVSDENTAVTKKLMLRGTGLRNVQSLVLTGYSLQQPVQLNASGFTTDSDTMLEVLIQVPANTSGNDFTFVINGSNRNEPVVTIKNAADIEREKAEAEHKRLVAQAQAGAAAAAQVKTLQGTVASQLQSISALEQRLKALEGKATIDRTEAGMMIARELKGVHETLKIHGDLISATATATQQAQQAVGQLQADMATVASEEVRRGGFLGIGSRKEPKYPQIASRYERALAAANAAAGAASPQPDGQR